VIYLPIPTLVLYHRLSFPVLRNIAAVNKAFPLALIQTSAAVVAPIFMVRESPSSFGDRPAFTPPQGSSGPVPDHLKPALRSISPLPFYPLRHSPKLIEPFLFFRSLNHASAGRSPVRNAPLLKG